ncbi:MAG TPA: histidine phosphatase family protein, partial [Myxococcota bacterium]|nr:histidine phosphatase family protein [Myxococcota bacterium]
MRVRGSLALGAALAVFVLGASVAAAEPPAPIFVVRHAKKLDAEDPDSPLSRAGAARARALAERLRDRGIRTIVVSEKRRTRETAAPLAQRLGLEPTAIASAVHVEDPRALAASIREQLARGAVLVVTHSDAIPGLVCALAGKAVPEVGEDEYDRIYTIEGAALA